MPKGYLSIVLHAHLPYIRHPEHENFLEEDWFFEAITETYIPLIKMMDGLVRDGVDYKLTISLSPTLMSMMMDSHLQYKYLKHIDKIYHSTRIIIVSTHTGVSLARPPCIAVICRDTGQVLVRFKGSSLINPVCPKQKSPPQQCGFQRGVRAAEGGCTLCPGTPLPSWG